MVEKVKKVAATKITAARDAADVATTTGTVTTDKANIPPATEIDPSGAPVQIVPDVDLAHPAVDNDPRKGTSVNQNRIDFNDPTTSGAEAVADNLNAQGLSTKTEEQK
jgi:hypothetical protein